MYQFTDAKFGGEKKVKARKIRDKIKLEVISFLAQIGIETEIA